MFQEWQTQSEGTYQCLRQQIGKYSIFSGRNILKFHVALYPYHHLSHLSIPLTQLISYIPIMDQHATVLADTVSLDLTYFSSSLSVASSLKLLQVMSSPNWGVSAGHKSWELLHLARHNYEISPKKQVWTDNFIAIFSSPAPHSDLAACLSGDSSHTE